MSTSVVHTHTDSVQVRSEQHTHNNTGSTIPHVQLHSYRQPSTVLPKRHGTSIAAGHDDPHGDRTMAIYRKVYSTTQLQDTYELSGFTVCAL